MNRYRVTIIWSLIPGGHIVKKSGVFTAETAADAEECGVQAWWDPALESTGWKYEMEVKEVEDGKA